MNILLSIQGRHSHNEVIFSREDNVNLTTIQSWP